MQNEVLRTYSHERLTPTAEQRQLVADIYASVCSVLGEHRCRQIGSFPRFTAIRPPHDLDILFKAGFSRDLSPDPSEAVKEIAALLDEKFEAPNGLLRVIRIQSHSVSIILFQGGEEQFGVDIVPGWETGDKSQDFGDDIFRVPELILTGHNGRQRKYERVAEGISAISFILTDPVGYIHMAQTVNDKNADFRRSTKCGKRFKHIYKDSNEDFRFKSFHLEQIMTGYFHAEPGLEIYPALVRFFEDLPSWISHSQIPDRADSSRMIDAYVDDLSDAERSAILAWRDEMRGRLQRFDGTGDVAALFEEQGRPIPSPTVIARKAPAIITSNLSPRAPYGD